MKLAFKDDSLVINQHEEDVVVEFYGKLTESGKPVLFYSEESNWGIINLSLIDTIKGDVELNSWNNVTLKGTFEKPLKDTEYKITARQVLDEKYGLQYENVCMNMNVDLSDEGKQKKFLSHILTENQLNNLYDTLDNPFNVIKEEDVKQLTTVKGIGVKSAMRIVDRYKQTIDNSAIYVELSDYGLTSNMVKKLLDKYKSPQLVVHKLKDNPYILIDDVEGVGWKKADAIALSGGLDIHSPKRVGAFIKYYLKEEANKGNTYIHPKVLMQIITQYLGGVEKDTISGVINELKENNTLWWNNVKDKIGLLQFVRLEENVAKELLRIKNGKNNFKYEGWKDTIKEVEKKQGWEFTEEQVNGIQTVLEEQLVIITGSGGTGKTSIVNGQLEVLKDYVYSQVALSGKASARLAEVTGKEGKTIHRLLRVDKSSDNGFTYNKNCWLPDDVIIIDEASMIGGQLFYDLIQSIRTGAKVVLLGDINQLEAIGVMNTFKDMIDSDIVKVVNLTQIHRQAMKSAIITDSKKVSEGSQITDTNYSGNEIRGELQDFEIDIYNDKDLSKATVIKQFRKHLKLVDDIMDIQVVVPMKTRGDCGSFKLNSSLQDICNPYKIGKKEVIVNIAKDKSYVLREGDKVLNVKNNYDIYDVNGNKLPIFNGSTGILLEIDEKNSTIMADFEGVGEVIIKKGHWKYLELGYAMTVHKCVTEDTWIYTSEGMKQIKELDNGALVGEFKSMSDSDLKVFNGHSMEKPSHFYNAGFSECRRIVTQRGYNIEVTTDHRLDVLTEEGYFEQKYVKDIVEGDHLLMAKGNMLEGKETNLPIEWQDRGDYDVRTVLYSRPKVMTKGFARFLGYMVGDGTVAERTIKLSKKHIEVTEDFAKLVENLFGYKKESGIKYRKSGDHMYEVGSADIAQFCKKIDGLQPHNKFIPQCIMQSPIEYQYEFLRGVFEDGSVGVKSDRFDCVNMSMSNIFMWEQMKTLLLNMGIDATFRIRHKKRKNPHYYIYIYSAKNGILFHDDIGFTSVKKQEKLRKVFNNKVSSPHFSLPNVHKVVFKLIEKNGLKIDKALNGSKLRNSITINKLKEFVDIYENDLKHEKDFKYLKNLVGNQYVDFVKTIETTHKNTYCLTMPQSHKFVQNGFYGSNCQGAQYKIVIVGGIDSSAYLMLVRELIYTGLSRGEERTILCAENTSLHRAINTTKVLYKQTLLKELLKGINKDKI